MRLRVGDRVDFVPYCVSVGQGGRILFLPGNPRTLRGTIVYINLRHRYYTVEYKMHNYILHESFKF